MKKNLLIAFLNLGIGFISFGQFQVSMTNVGSQLTFKVKPIVNTNASFKVLEFFVSYPSTTPAFTYGTIVENTTNFPGMTDFTVQAEPEAGGFKYDHFIYTAPAPVTTPKDYLAGQEYEVFTVTLIGAGTVDLAVVHKEDFKPFYLALTNGQDADISTGNPATYFYPVTLVTGTGNNTVYSQVLLNVPLPVKFLSFYALKNGDDARLSWTVAEDADNKYFDIQRSTNGRDYATFTRVNALENGKNINTYETTDAVLSKHGIKDIYYRIKQVDKSGGAVYSVIRSLNIGRSTAISLFPNPARSTSKLVIDVPNATKAAIIVRDITGKQVQLMNVQFVKGINQKDINVSSLPAGEYNVTILSESLNQTIKLSKLN